MRPYQFGCDCDGMVQAILRAATPGRYHGVDPSLDMDPTDQAVWWAKLVMRRARNLGLIDQECARKADRIALGGERRSA